VAELGADPGWPRHLVGELRPLAAGVASLIPKFDDIGIRTSRFYTTEQVDWAALGITATHEAQLLLSCVDPHIVTITGLTHHSVGRPYDICLGRPDDARAMMAHALAQEFEVEQAIRLCDALRKETAELGIAMAAAYEQLLTSFIRLRGRQVAWRTVKRSLRRLVIIRSESGRLDLLRMSLEEAVGRRLTATNSPKQIFIPGEATDPQRMIAHVRPFFHSARVDNAKLVDLSDKPAVPLYAEDVAAFARKRQLLQESLASEIDEGRSTIAAFQTEFSWYALMAALVGVVIAIAAAALSLSQRGSVSTGAPAGVEVSHPATPAGDSVGFVHPSPDTSQLNTRPLTRRPSPCRPTTPSPSKRPRPKSSRTPSSSAVPTRTD